MNFLTLGVIASVPPKTNSKLMQDLWPLIELLQEFALPIGIAVSIWGVIEWVIGNQAGIRRVKVAVVGFILVFIIPLFFIKLHNTFTSGTFMR